MESTHIYVEDLHALAAGVVAALGTPEDLAQTVADSLAEANLAGHDSHGIVQLPGYASQVRSGQVHPAARPEVTRRRGATAKVSAGRGWGQPAARIAAVTASQIAANSGVGAVAVSECSQVGRLAEYANLIASAGKIGFVTANAPAVVTPHGGLGRLLGTNPMAFGIPRGGGNAAIVPDVATSVVAEGALELDRARGATVAPDTIIRADGSPTTSPPDFYREGALLPAADHKGYGLAVAIEALGGILSGTGASMLPGYGGGNGVFMFAVDISTFTATDKFLAEVESMCSALTSATPMGSRGVRMPGQPENATAARRQRDGVPVPETVWEQVSSLASDLGVAIPG